MTETIDRHLAVGTNLIKANKKFKSWKRSERHVRAAQTRWAKKRK